MPSDPVTNVLRHIEGAKKIGDGKWLCFCPVHEKPSNGHQRSLSVSQGDDGRVLVHCHAGCSHDDICTALGMGVGDLFGEARKSAAPAKRRARRTFETPEAAYDAIAREVRGAFVTNWSYPGDVFRVARFLLPDGGKTYRPIHREGEGWVIGDPAGLLPLYRGDEIPGSGPVVVLEGEKCVDAAASVGLVGVTSAHGAEAAAKGDWRPLAGRDVIILPDNDAAGAGYAEEVASILSGLTPPARVKIVTLPDLPEGGDIIEWLDIRDAQEPEALQAMILELAVAAPIWTPDTDRIRSGSPDKADCVSVNAGGEAYTQPVPAYQPFPVEQLPGPARNLVTEGAASIGCDPALIALPLLSGLAAAIGNTRSIELKPGWAEPAVIYTAVVADSGARKSPAHDKALHGLTVAQDEAFRRNVEEAKSYEAAKLAYDADLADWRKSGRKRHEPVPEPPSPPTPTRYIVSDTTTEALVCILSENPRGVLVARDELSGWVESFDCYREGRGGDTAFWLSAHRAGPVTVDRKSGDKRTLHVPHAAVCVCGTIQPDVLCRVLGKTHVEDGLLPRFLLAHPPRTPRRWTDSEVSSKTLDAAARLYKDLLALDMEADGNGNPSPRRLTLTLKARELWIAFVNEHGVEMDTLTGALAAVWSKLEGYAARFALILHLVRVVSGEATLHDQVDADSIKAGIVLAKWFGGEARRAYRVIVESPEDREQRLLIEWIEAKGGRVSVREATRGGPCYKTAEEAEAALGALVKVGIGTWSYPKPASGPGRPSKVFVLNPAEITDTDKIAIGNAASGDSVSVSSTGSGEGHD